MLPGLSDDEEVLSDIEEIVEEEEEIIDETEEIHDEDELDEQWEADDEVDDVDKIIDRQPIVDIRDMRRLKTEKKTAHYEGSPLRSESDADIV
jgi:hypothetical protein